MRNMRKITALCLCLLLMMSLTGCDLTRQAFTAKPPTAEQLAAAKAAEQTPMRPKTWYAAFTDSEAWADFFYDAQGGLSRIETYTRNTNGIGTNSTTYRCEPQTDGITKVYRNSELVMTLNPAGQCMELLAKASEPHQFYYDEQGRLVRETWDNEREEFRMQWDDENRLIGWECIQMSKQYRKWYRDENGDVMRMDYRYVGWATPKEEYTMEYVWAYENDEAGRLAAKTVYYGKVGDPERKTMEALRYLYDDTGALCGMVTNTEADRMGLYTYGQMTYSTPPLLLTRLRDVYDWEEWKPFYPVQYRIVWEVVPQ